MCISVKIPDNHGGLATSLLNCSMLGRNTHLIAMETAPLDPSLPGVRLLQSWIREQLPISIAVLGQEPIEGRLIWQDPEFLAIERAGASRPVLINRRQISVIRSLG